MTYKEMLLQAVEKKINVYYQNDEITVFSPNGEVLINPVNNAIKEIRTTTCRLLYFAFEGLKYSSDRSYKTTNKF